MDWYLPISDFKNGSETILVDVNGSDLPNELGTDRFEYKVKPGLKVEVEEPTFYAPTGAPPSKGTGGGAPAGPDKDNRTAQNVYSIVCGAGSGATIYGEGSNKVNGTYTLVAVPNKGKACNWFIHQVTVKDSDVTDCNLRCWDDNNVPTSDGETIVPPPVPDEPDEPDTYCINVTVTGDSDQCTVSGAGCGKEKGLHTVSVSSKDPSNYSPEWSSKKYTIVDKDISDTVSCDKIEPGESCYKITVQGSAEEKANCPVTLPAGNCPEGNEGGPYKSGTHTVVVTPKDGYTFNNSSEASDVKVTIADKDGVVDLTGKCKPASAAKIEITTTGLSVSYGGANTTGTTPTLSVNGDTIIIKAAQDVTIKGLNVVPSDKTKPWKIIDADPGGYSVSPTSGTGQKPFEVSVSKNHTEGFCLYAKYTDNSAESNKVCFIMENPITNNLRKITLSWEGKGCEGFQGNVNLTSSKANQSNQSFGFGTGASGSKELESLPGDYSVSVSNAMVKGKGATAWTETRSVTVNPTSLSNSTSGATIKVTTECNDKCSPSNTYKIKVTETCTSSNCQKPAGSAVYNSVGHELLAGGPWWGSGVPFLNRDGTGSVKGGEKFSMTANTPSYTGTVIKSVTVNGKTSSPNISVSPVCEDQNVVIDYDVNATSQTGCLDVYVSTNGNGMTSYDMAVSAVVKKGSGKWKDAQKFTLTGIPVGSQELYASSCMGDFGGPSYTKGVASISPSSVVIPGGSTCARAEFSCNQGGGDPTKCALTYGYTNQMGSGPNGRRLTVVYNMTCTGNTRVDSNMLVFYIKDQNGRTMHQLARPIGGKVGAENNISGNEECSYNFSGDPGDTHYVELSTTADYVSATCSPSHTCSQY